MAVGLYDIDYVCRFHHYLDIDICAIALLILYVVLAATGNTGGKDKYKVTCDNLTDDVINGRGICKITNSRCKMRDTGVCPYN